MRGRIGRVRAVGKTAPAVLFRNDGMSEEKDEYEQDCRCKQNALLHAGASMSERSLKCDGRPGMELPDPRSPGHCIQKREIRLETFPAYPATFLMASSIATFKSSSLKGFRRNPRGSVPITLEMVSVSEYAVR